MKFCGIFEMHTTFIEQKFQAMMSVTRNVHSNVHFIIDLRLKYICILWPKSKVGFGFSFEFCLLTCLNDVHSEMIKVLGRVPGSHNQKRPNQPLKKDKYHQKIQIQDIYKTIPLKHPNALSKRQYVHILCIKRKNPTPLVNFSKLLVLLKSNLKL